MSTSSFSVTRSEVICRAKDPTTCKYHGTISKLNDAAQAEDFDEYMWLRDKHEVGRQEEIAAFQAEVQETERWGLRGDRDVFKYLVREAERGMQAQNQLLGEIPPGEDPFNEGYRDAYVVLATRMRAAAEVARKPSRFAKRMSPAAAGQRAATLLRRDRRAYIDAMPEAAPESIDANVYREGYVEAVNQFVMDYDGKGVG